MGITNSSTRAVLADLDGTLVNTAPDIVAAVNRMLVELSAPPLLFKTVWGFIGHGVPNLVRCVLEARDLERTIEGRQAQELFFRHYRATNGSFGTVYPGVREGLSEIRRLGYRLACVSNKPLEFTQTLLKLTELDGYFDTVVAGDSTAQMKPAPEPLLHACRILQVAPENSLMVGDSAVDARAAHAAGMPVYLVTYGYPGAAGLDTLPCTALIDSFEQIPALLAKSSLTDKENHNHDDQNCH